MVIANILNFCFPPRCLSCKKIVNGADGLCPECFAKISFISEPLCRKCGRPFEFDGIDAAGGLCRSCQHHPPPWKKLIAVTVYDDFSRRLILPLKHADETGHAKLLSLIMASVGWELLAKADMLIPVPLSRQRLFMRMYNQSALLALAIGRRIRKPAATSLLLRQSRKTDGQKGLTREEREANVKDAFKVADHAAIKGKNIVLIDDVVTTGATLSACTRTLKSAGAKSVSCLVFAKALPAYRNPMI